MADIAPETPFPDPSPSSERDNQNGLGKRTEPKEVLPTDRIAFDKQLQLLRAYAAASDDGARPVSNDDVAKLVDMNASTVSLANSFFSKVGFLTKSGREFAPAREVLEYKRATDWGADNAAEKLTAIVERAWFAQALRAKLQMRPVDVEEAIADLAQRAEVSPKYRPQLRMLINYLDTSGIVIREGNQLILVRRNQDTIRHEAQPEPTSSPPTPPPQNSVVEPRSTNPTFGGINFNVSISADMAEISRWPPDRIAAFFDGLAKVIAARGHEHGET